MTKEYTQKDMEKLKKKRGRKKNAKEMDKVFAGYKDLKSLSRGVCESDENDEEVNGEEEEGQRKVKQKDDKRTDKGKVEDEEGLPEKWAKIATGDESTREKMRAKIEETNRRTAQILSELREKTKEKKAGGCIGNKNHDKQGRFSSKKTAKSASIRKPNNTDCKAGTTRANPTRWLKHPDKCGREGKYKCSTDGVKDGYRQDESDQKVRRSLQKVWEEDRKSFLIIKTMFEEWAKEEQVLEGEDEQKEREKGYCRKKYGLRTLKDYLQLVNSIQQAEKGDLNKPPK
jgi:hypothetical protein